LQCRFFVELRELTVLALEELKGDCDLIRPERLPLLLFQLFQSHEPRPAVPLCHAAIVLSFQRPPLVGCKVQHGAPCAIGHRLDYGTLKLLLCGQLDSQRGNAAERLTLSGTHGAHPK
jgi:hypothetical protein